MLVVVHHGDVERFLQPFLNIEAFRCFDVFQIDAAKRRCNPFNGLTKLYGVFLVYLDVEYVDAAIYLEQQAFAFHHGLATHGTNVPQAQHCRAVGDHCDQVSLVGVFVSIIFIILNLKTRIGHAWRIGQAQVCLRSVWFGGFYFNLAGTFPLMVSKSCFFGDF